MITHEEFVEALISQLPALRRYAMALIGNASMADDLIQDSIERAIRQAAQLRDLQRLQGWLRRILYNAYIDEIRRNRRRGRQEDIADLVDDPELSVPAMDGTSMRDFVKAIRLLSPEHRQILLLVGLEELNYREIAKELDIPIGTVMSRLARARERLRGMLEEGAEIIPLSSRLNKKP